jgi:hypothetical protein
MGHLAALGEQAERMLIDLQDSGGLAEGQELYLHKGSFAWFMLLYRLFAVADEPSVSFGTVFKNVDFF